MVKENHSQIGIREFVHNAITLPDDEFEKAMRLDNNDKDINDVEILAWTKESMELYERS